MEFHSAGGEIDKRIDFEALAWARQAQFLSYSPVTFQN